VKALLLPLSGFFCRDGSLPSSTEISVDKKFNRVGFFWRVFWGTFQSLVDSL
jgi:hypothetical protein